jgi:DNA-binding transcriptional ArsR family regulator
LAYYTKAKYSIVIIMAKSDKKAKRDPRVALGRNKRRQGRETRAKILNFLTEQPLTHKELLKKTGLTASALSPHLRELMKNRIIEKTFSADGKKIQYEVLSKHTASEIYIKYIIDMIVFSYGNPLFPETEQRIRDALRDDMEKKGFIKPREGGK